MRVLLHLCCGPCAVWPLANLRDQGYDVTGFWYNPNIHPWREHQRRLDSCRRLAQIEGLALQEGPAEGVHGFLSHVWPLVDGGSRRCHGCYELRLTGAANRAIELGVRTITSTLLVSPYQDHSAIRAAGDAAARAAGLAFLYQDWRPGFRQARVRSREMGLYHQSYCGCVFSEEERYRSDGAGLGQHA